MWVAWAASRWYIVREFTCLGRSIKTTAFRERTLVSALRHHSMGSRTMSSVLSSTSDCVLFLPSAAPDWRPQVALRGGDSGPLGTSREGANA